DLHDPGTFQRQPVRRPQVEVGAAVCCAVDQPVYRAERLAHRFNHFLTDLVTLRPDARPDPGLDVRRIGAERILHGADGARRGAQDRPAPAGVHDPRRMAHRVVQQDRRAVRIAHRQRQPRLIGDHPVGARQRATVGQALPRDDRIRAVCLPDRAGARFVQARRGVHPAVILTHDGRVVADRPADVQRRARRIARPTMPREDPVDYAILGGPLVNLVIDRAVVVDPLHRRSLPWSYRQEFIIAQIPLASIAWLIERYGRIVCTGRPRYNTNMTNLFDKLNVLIQSRVPRLGGTSRRRTPPALGRKADRELAHLRGRIEEALADDDRAQAEVNALEQQVADWDAQADAALAAGQDAVA